MFRAGRNIGVRGVLFFSISLLQCFDVNFVHLEHRLHDPLRFFLVLVIEQLAQNRGNNLPRHAEFIFQPAAFRFFPASGKLLPEVINFILSSATDEERNGFREFELRPTVQRHELHSVEMECGGHSAYAFNFRVLEDGRVKLRRFPGFAVEPQEWGDLLHIVVFVFEWIVLGGENEARENAA